jgi:alpha/beta superfamily hydrolase
MTRPDAFAALVHDFVRSVRRQPPATLLTTALDPVARPDQVAVMPALELSGSAGRLEALLDEPAPAGSIGADGIVSGGYEHGVRAAVVFAHPHTEYGGTMHTKVVYQAAKALSRIGCAVLRFNFRGAGASAGQFTNGPGEMDDFRAALTAMTEKYPGAPLWAAGMSFGSWVALTVGAEDPRVSTLGRHRAADSRDTTSAPSSAARSRSSSSTASSTSCVR